MPGAKYFQRDNLLMPPPLVDVLLNWHVLNLDPGDHGLQMTVHWPQSMVLSHVIVQVIDQMIEQKVGERELSAPSISYGNSNLYMQGPLEAVTRDNLSKVRNDRSLSATFEVHQE